MKVARGIVVFSILLVLFLSIFFLFRNYQTLRGANRYITFVTNSTNEIITEVDSVNVVLNDLNAGESNDQLLSEIEKVGNIVDRVNGERGTYLVPYKGEEVDYVFGESLAIADTLLRDLQNLQLSIENLEDSTTFNEKLNIYVKSSQDLKEKSEQLQEIITTFTSENNTIDIKRIIYGL